MLSTVGGMFRFLLVNVICLVFDVYDRLSKGKKTTSIGRIDVSNLFHSITVCGYKVAHSDVYNTVLIRPGRDYVKLSAPCDELECIIPIK